MDTKIIEQLEQAFAEEFKLVQNDLGATEELVRQKMQLLGQGLLQRVVNQHPNGYKGSCILCECGGSMRFVGYRTKDIHSIYGWIKVKRSYYHCPDCGKSLIPYDVASGLGSEQLSPGLAKSCCLLGVDDSFESSSRKIEEFFGQKVSANTIERLMNQVGGVVLRQSDEQSDEFRHNRHIPDAQQIPERLYIAADGTTVHEMDGWHEFKTGVIYHCDEHQNRQSCYVGTFNNCEIFGWQLWLEACRSGLRRAQEVVFLGDGAAWIRSLHKQHFGRATFIIDWYHASEHIWSCGEILFGEGTEATKIWANKCLDLLWDGWTRKLLKLLEKARKRLRGKRREAMDSLHHYIMVNEEQMRYDLFRAKGYDIGSGSVEGACKYVVGKRLKQSGMIWSRDGSSSVLALRIIWLNNRWDRLWKQKPLAA